MTIDYFQEQIEALMPDNYQFKVNAFNSTYSTTIYRDNERVDTTSHESLTYAFNHILGYFKTMQTLKK